MLITSFAACSPSGSNEVQSSAESSVTSQGTEISGPSDADSSSEEESSKKNDSSGKNFDDIFGDGSSAQTSKPEEQTEDGQQSYTEKSAQSSDNGQTPPEMPQDQSGMLTPPDLPQQSDGQFPQQGDGQFPQRPDSGQFPQQSDGQFPQRPDSGQFPQQGDGQFPQQGGTTSESKAPEIDKTSLLTERDLEQTADTSSAKTIHASDNKTETITEEGVYVIKGTASEFTVKVAADSKAKVQLVLDGLNVTNSSFPVIYVSSADKCFVTTTDKQNSLSVTGTFTADGDVKTDAVIFSKADIVLNGTGTLEISSTQNGISCKDDLKITGGTYRLTTTKDAIEANDSIVISDGSFEIRSSKDGLHCENDDDDTKGFVYIKGGSINIDASSDAIQAATYLIIDGGNVTAKGSEGLEATYVQINDGSVKISATDDGINASSKSTSVGTPTVEITGGSLNITMSGGDVDCIDSNGNIIVSGGTIDLTYPAQAPSESFDSTGTAQYSGGTIIINGTQVDSIPQSMMGGGMGGRGNRGSFYRGGMMDNN